MICPPSKWTVAVRLMKTTLESRGASWHQVIDGGRDSRGSANVVAGEGTGIVHMAPGCGDIDHKIGVSVGMPVIAPLQG